MDLRNKISYSSFTYVIFVVGWTYLGFIFRPGTEGIIGFALWFMVYVGVNFLIGDYAKNWFQTVCWLLFVPTFAMCILIGDKNSAILEGKVQFILLIISYSIFWIWGALRFNKEQYKCAISFILALLTSGIGLFAYDCFIPSSQTIGQLSIEETYKFVGILASIFFMADRWGKFALDYRDMKEKKQIDNQ